MWTTENAGIFHNHTAKPTLITFKQLKDVKKKGLLSASQEAQPLSLKPHLQLAVKFLFSLKDWQQARSQADYAVLCSGLFLCEYYLMVNHQYLIAYTWLS